MQIGDTSQEQYTPYYLLEYYNEGNHLLNALIGQYCPSLATGTFEGTGRGRITLPFQCISILNVKADDTEVQGYQVLNLQTVVFDADTFGKFVGGGNLVIGIIIFIILITRCLKMKADYQRNLKHC